MNEFDVLTALVADSELRYRRAVVLPAAERRAGVMHELHRRHERRSRADRGLGLPHWLQMRRLTVALVLALVLLAGAHGDGLRSAHAEDAGQLKPDLTIGISGYQYSPGFHQITIRNPQIRFWDPDLRRWEYAGAPATGVAMRSAFTIRPNAHASDGLVIASVSGTHGFSCSASGLVVSCTGGALAPGATATITVRVWGPAGLSFTHAATVDPYNAVAERLESNNVASFDACFCDELFR